MLNQVHWRMMKIFGLRILGLCRLNYRLIKQPSVLISLNGLCSVQTRQINCEISYKEKFLPSDISLCRERIYWARSLQPSLGDCWRRGSSWQPRLGERTVSLTCNSDLQHKYVRVIELKLMFELFQENRSITTEWYVDKHRNCHRIVHCDPTWCYLHTDMYLIS